MDLRGFIVPFTYLKVSQIFRSLAIGDRLEIRWGDRDSLEDLFKILPESTYEVLRIAECGDSRFECNVILRKIASAKATSAIQEPHCAGTEHGAIK